MDKKLRGVYVSSRSLLPDYLKFLSDRVRYEREMAGMTQKTLAEAAGIPQSHLSRIECGHLTPTHKTREKLANALGIKVEAFAMKGPYPDGDE